MLTKLESGESITMPTQHAKRIYDALIDDDKFKPNLGPDCENQLRKEKDGEYALVEMTVGNGYATFHFTEGTL